MRFKAALGASCSILLILGFSQRSTAQMAPGVYADANHPAGAPDPEKVDEIWQVDPITGSVSIKIPFATTPAGGRGPKLPFALSYSSSSTVTLQAQGAYSLPGLGYLIGVSGPPQNISEFTWSPEVLQNSPGPTGPWTTTGPFMYSTSVTVPLQQYTVQPGTSGQQTIYLGDGCWIEGPYIYVDENGAAHDMNLERTNSYSASSGGTEYESPPCRDAYTASQTYGQTSSTSDGSALQTFDTNEVLYPDGTQYSASGFEDSNGNKAFASVSGSTYTSTDSLGRAAFTTNIPIGGANQVPVGTYNVTTTSATGSSESYSVVFSTQTIGSFNMPHPTDSEIITNFYCVGSITCPTSYAVSQPTAGSTFSAVTSVTRPDGTSYTFQYDPTYGTISKINFPTGGYVRFVWAVQPIDGVDFGQYTYTSGLMVTDVYTSTGSGAEDHWNYNIAPNSNNATTTGSTVTTPDGSYAKYTGACFVYGIVTLYETGTKPSCKEASRSIYSSGGSLIRSITKSFDSEGETTQEATTLYDGAGPMQQITQYVYDAYNNISEKDESDFNSCASPCTPPAYPSAPSSGWIRKTFTTYQYQSVPSWVTAHIVNKASQVLVTDGGGHPFSLVQFVYDQFALGGSPGFVNHDDVNYGSSSANPRGNLTTESHCATLASTTTVTPSTAASACSLWLKTTNYYDLTGQKTSTYDPNNNLTTFSYNDVYAEGTPPGPTDGYLTKITYANGLTESFSYDYSSGQLASHADPNGLSTTYAYSDSLNRLTATTYPDTGNVQINYNDAAPPSVTVTTATGQPEGPIVKATQYDGLGRVSQTKLTSDPFTADYVDTAYDSNGRVYSVSNPHRSASATSDGTTTKSYDALDRPLIVTNPDGTTRKFIYAANTVTTVDENLNQWKRTTNGIGQLTFAYEPNGSSQTSTMETDYTYNPVGDLLTVTQWGGAHGSSGARSRSFTFDGMSRLLTSTNPESGKTTYTYDGDGNVHTKTDARGVAISYTYDKLNRLNWKHYSDGFTPAAGFGYDGNDATGNPISPAVLYAKGRLSQLSIVSSQAISNFSFDKMGRLAQKISCVPGDCTYDIKVLATYNLAGELLTLTNGSANHPITLTYANDAAGRVKQITGSPTVNSIATLFQATSTSPDSYGPTGLTHALLGVNTSNVATFALNRGYDNRLRSMYGTYSNSGGTTLYSFCIPGGSNPNCSSSNPGFQPNGNLANAVDSVMGTWAYTYDTLNRPLTGTVGAQYACWSYDPFGDRTSESMSSTACNNNPPQLSWAHYTTSNSNRMDATSQNAAQSSGYDAAGNVTFDGVSTYVYDGEGRICAVKSEPIPGTYVMTEYIYDSQGNRVGKGSITTLSCNKSTNGFVAKAGYVTGLNGEQMTETNGTPQWVHTNVFANGSLIATYHDTSLYFSFEDWLGTKRAEGGVLSGGACLNTYYSLPFGNDLTTTGTCADATEHHFTQKERDAESGNDYFEARYYTSAFGRFMSPDWTAKEEDDDPVPYAVLDDPQSLNLYAYVRNNPLTRVDADGHDGCCEGVIQGGQQLEQEIPIPQIDAIIGGVVTVATFWDNRDAIADKINNAMGEIGSSGAGSFGGQYGDFSAQAPANALQSKDASAKGPVKGADSPTVTSNGQAATASGEKRGPSGDPMGHSTDHSTKKGAKEAAAQSSKDGKVRNDTNPKDGRGGHFHPNETDKKGSEHHYYPKKNNP